MDPSNPYDAPRANLLELAAEGDDELLAEPRSLDAGNAVGWYAKGWEYFVQAPGTWIALFLLYLVAMLILSCIPFATNLLAPVFTAGVAIGADRLRRGQELGIDALFDGFRSEHVGQLILVGLFTMLLTLGAVLVAMPVMMLMSAAVGAAGESSDAAGVVVVGVFIVVLAAVTFPLAMATAFSPLLVAFHGKSAFEAMLLSLRGCWVNLGGAIVWALLAIVAFVLGALPFFLGLLVVAPLMMAVNYAAYRDIYYRNG
jgi:uncharacterized membrane protein